MEVPDWLIKLIDKEGVSLWGIADVQGIVTPKDITGNVFPTAISWSIPINPEIMISIQNGPNQSYAEEYQKINDLITRQTTELTSIIKHHGYQSLGLPASERSNKENFKATFPHKTAATQSGIGWIGRHCQLITRKYGSWVRLGTVLTDMPLPLGKPQEDQFCGECSECVDACPANALKGNAWFPGISREKLLDVHRCESWKKGHYREFHGGQNCGICSAVCPFGVKSLKRRAYD